MCFPVKLTNRGFTTLYGGQIFPETCIFGGSGCIYEIPCFFGGVWRTPKSALAKIVVFTTLYGPPKSAKIPRFCVLVRKSDSGSPWVLLFCQNWGSTPPKITKNVKFPEMSKNRGFFVVWSREKPHLTPRKPLCVKKMQKNGQKWSFLAIF
jgi:hypothetical protein